MSSKRPPADSGEVARAIRAIRDYHELGRQSRKQSKSTVEQQAAEVGCAVAWLRKARQFAHPTKGYSRQRLERLCELIATHSPVFGLSHLTLLMPIPWPRRARFQERCIRRNLSLRDLRLAKAKRFKRLNEGGRRHQVDPHNAVARLEEIAHAYGRLVKELTRTRGEEPAVIDSLPEGVRRAAEGAVAPMRWLRKAAIARLSETRGPG